MDRTGYCILYNDVWVLLNRYHGSIGRPFGGTVGLVACRIWHIHQLLRLVQCIPADADFRRNHPDKLGVRMTGLGAAVLWWRYAIKYWAVSTRSLGDTTLFGLNAQVFWASIGFAVFAVGLEVAGITVSKIIVKWFKGKEMAMAMGMEMAMARIGTALALGFSVPIAKATGMVNVSRPVLVALIGLCIGLIAFIVYVMMDKKLDASEALTEAESADREDDEFKIADIGKILTNKGWWFIAILCVLFYSAVFPFLKYATDLMVNKFGVKEDLAGLIPMLLPFGNILLTPLFGSIYDRKGKGASIMIIGGRLWSFGHAVFSIPGLDNWFFAIILRDCAWNSFLVGAFCHVAFGTEDYPRESAWYGLFAYFLGAELGIDGCAPAYRVGAREVLRYRTNRARRTYRKYLRLYNSDAYFHKLRYFGTCFCAAPQIGG